MAYERHSVGVDGRRIDYLEFGDPEGVPALHLHGTPSSACAGAWLDGASRVHSVRIISPDRPGYFGSGVASDPSVTGTSAHLLAFARALSLERFGVAAFSGGACFALGLAYLAPDEVTVVHVGGGLGSLAATGTDVLGRGRRLMFGALAAPVTGSLIQGAMVRLMRRQVGKRLSRSSAEAAEEIYGGAARGDQVAAVASYIHNASPDQLQREIRDHIDAASFRGVVDDVRAYRRPWPFEPREIRTRVEIWHGLDDPAVPAGFARAMSGQLQDGAVHLLEGEGHFVFHTHADEVAASIRERA
jgi:pimeloyl-ACP methyl ester carboxylesterase